MGYVVGAMTEKHDQYGWKVAAIFAAFVIKIVGYYIAEIILYGNFIAPISSVWKEGNRYENLWNYSGV